MNDVDRRRTRAWVFQGSRLSSQDKFSALPQKKFLAFKFVPRDRLPAITSRDRPPRMVPSVSGSSIAVLPTKVCVVPGYGLQKSPSLGLPAQNEFICQFLHAKKWSMSSRSATDQSANVQHQTSGTTRQVSPHTVPSKSEDGVPRWEFVLRAPALSGEKFSSPPRLYTAELPSTKRHSVACYRSTLMGRFTVAQRPLRQYISFHHLMLSIACRSTEHPDFTNSGGVDCHSYGGSALA